MKLKDIIKFFKTYFKEDKSLLIKSFILLFLTSLVGTLYGYLIGLAIDLARTQEYLSGIIVLLVIFLINSIDGLFFDRYGKINLEKFANNIMEKISYNVFVKVGLLPSVAFEEKSSGELINRTVNDATTIAESFRQVLRIAISLFTSIIVFIYICFNSLYVSLIIIIYLILFYFISKKYLPNIKDEQEHINKEKDEIMEQFKNGEIQILISTTVIEVGVNVPNASIMVVENAERFGLAQLHQLRGRVGRGEYQSYCILKFEGNGKTTKERMKVMCQTNDGFIISEKDLELRGSGDFFGTEQHGIPEFKIANLFEDMGTLKKVQKIAMEIMADDPLLEKEKNIKLNELVKEKFSSRIEI